ncbi:MAG: PIN domain-containing protein [Myxococcota bacterium]
MSRAYVDTSFLVAVALQEPNWRALRRSIGAAEALYSSELLVAEFLATAARERLSAEATRAALSPVTVVIAERTIRPEIERALAAGRLRGADLWHVACALYLTPDPAQLAFLSRDAEQRAVAAKLGFPTP